MRLLLILGLLVVSLATATLVANSEEPSDAPAEPPVVVVSPIAPPPIIGAEPVADEGTAFPEEPEPSDPYFYYYGYDYWPDRPYWPPSDSIFSLADIERELTAFLEGSVGQASVAIYQPGHDFLLQINPEGLFPLASTVKVHLMLAYLDTVRTEGRDLTPDEEQLLEWMITISDNDSAAVFWYTLGAGRVSEFLRSRGLDTLPPPDDEGPWGDTLDTAPDLALVLGRLFNGELLEPADTEYALDLLSRVDPSQRWGIPAGIEGLEIEPAADVYLKNGWYPGDEGWRVNSGGIIVPLAGATPYVLVILTDGQPSYEYGVETIETMARLVNGFLVPPLPYPSVLPDNPAVAGIDLTATGLLAHDP